LAEEEVKAARRTEAAAGVKAGRCMEAAEAAEAGEVAEEAGAEGAEADCLVPRHHPEDRRVMAGAWSEAVRELLATAPAAALTG
jgi:hypothetical protein